MLNSGQHLLTPASMDVEYKVPAAKAFTTDLQDAVESAKAAWGSAQQKQAQYANQKQCEVTCRVHDQVLLSTKNVRLTTPGAKKLMPRWSGSYKVVIRIGEVAYRLDLPDALKIWGVFHASLLHEYRSDGAVQPPPTILTEGEAQFEVDRILDYRDPRLRNRGLKREYLIRWIGNGRERNSGEPEANLQNCQQSLSIY